jgi:hypothetical protein
MFPGLEGRGKVAVKTQNIRPQHDDIWAKPFLAKQVEQFGVGFKLVGSGKADSAADVSLEWLLNPGPAHAG